MIPLDCLLFVVAARRQLRLSEAIARDPSISTAQQQRGAQASTPKAPAPVVPIQRNQPYACASQKFAAAFGKGGLSRALRHELPTAHSSAQSALATRSLAALKTPARPQPNVRGGQCSERGLMSQMAGGSMLNSTCARRAVCIVWAGGTRCPAQSCRRRHRPIGRWLAQGNHSTNTNHT